MLKVFIKDKRGNFAIITALAMLPLVLAVGASIDTARHYAAQNHLQDLADSASLAMAASKEQNTLKLRTIAENYINANLARNTLGSVSITNLAADEDEVDLALHGSVETTLMALAGFETMDVNASSLAKRAASGTIEIALVLDNTYSMIKTDRSGQKKIDALKAAASGLIEQLMTNADGAIRIGLVPYADYVNVGTKYRNKSWLAIEARKGAGCTSITSEKICSSRSPTYSCTTTVDGVVKPATCGGECLSEQTVTYDPPKTTCDKPDTREWFGCVGSRSPGRTYHLNDENPSVAYPGLIDGSQKCLNPIVTLTDDKQALLNAINNMVIEKPYYQPLTYIPAGLIWGQNVLSPTEPFSDGADYDPKNKKPRKIMILMTDGANTMMFHSNSGHHGNMRGGENPKTDDDKKVHAQEAAQTNADSVSICDYMKRKNTEIFTVAFMVDDEEGKKLMQSCATDAKHYTDAADRPKLIAAFAGIAASISRVRLAR